MKLLGAIVIALVLAGCSKSTQEDQPKTSTTSDAVEQRQDDVNAAAKLAKKETDISADFQKKQIEAQRETIQAQLKADEAAAKAQEDLAKERAEAAKKLSNATQKAQDR